MKPKLRSLLARVALVGGVAGVAAIVARDAPHEQNIAIHLGSQQVTRVEAVVTRQGDSEPTVGFSQDFPQTSPRTIRHAFSAPNGTYIVVISLRHRSDGAMPPITAETSFERRVSLSGGEVTLSPD